MPIETDPGSINVQKGTFSRRFVLTQRIVLWWHRIRGRRLHRKMVKYLNGVVPGAYELAAYGKADTPVGRWTRHVGVYDGRAQFVPECFGTLYPDGDNGAHVPDWEFVDCPQAPDCPVGSHAQSYEKMLSEGWTREEIVNHPDTN